MALTEMAIRAAKPTDKTVKLSDGHGLQLHVQPTGSKLWRFAFRFGGKQKGLALGAYPTVTLARAREKAQEARRALSEGIDPSELRRVEKLTGARSRERTFGAIALELLEKREREGIADATRTKARWLLEFALPDLGQRDIEAISSAEVLAVLRKVESAGHLETARRLRSLIGRVFRHGIATARATNDPTVALRSALTAPRVKHRAAILNPKDFGAMLCAIDQFRGQSTTRAALQLLALLFVRPGELRLARWSEFNFTKAEWLIPAQRTKMRREHLVPLPTQALAILENLRPLTERGEDSLLFPSTRSVLKPMSENTLNGALRRLGISKDVASAHGFRASAATLLNESGLFSVDAIERALAHQDQSAVRRAYARGTYWDERVRLGQWWADQLDIWRSWSDEKATTKK